MQINLANASKSKTDILMLMTTPSMQCKATFPPLHYFSFPFPFPPPSNLFLPSTIFSNSFPNAFFAFFSPAHSCPNFFISQAAMIVNATTLIVGRLLIGLPAFALILSPIRSRGSVGGRALNPISERSLRSILLLLAHMMLV